MGQEETAEIEKGGHNVSQSVPTDVCRSKVNEPCTEFKLHLTSL